MLSKQKHFLVNWDVSKNNTKRVYSRLKRMNRVTAICPRGSYTLCSSRLTPLHFSVRETKALAVTQCGYSVQMTCN